MKGAEANMLRPAMTLVEQAVEDDPDRGGEGRGDQEQQAARSAHPPRAGEHQADHADDGGRASSHQPPCLAPSIPIWGVPTRLWAQYLSDQSSVNG